MVFFFSFPLWITGTPQISDRTDQHRSVLLSDLGLGWFAGCWSKLLCLLNEDTSTIREDSWGPNSYVNLGAPLVAEILKSWARASSPCGGSMDAVWWGGKQGIGGECRGQSRPLQGGRLGWWGPRITFFAILGVHLSPHTPPVPNERMAFFVALFKNLFLNPKAQLQLLW